MSELKSVSIIIAEDHAFYREGLKTLIHQTSNYKVIAEATNGEELIPLAMRLKPDLIIMDCNLSHLNGLQAIEKLNELGCESKIMILSMHDEDWFITKLIRAGVMGYMSKAAGIPELMEAIKIVVLEDGMYFPDSVHPNMARLIENSNIDPVRPSLPIFSPIELKVIEQLCKAFSNKEIAVALSLSKRTIDSHCVRIMDRMQVKNRSGLISYAYKMKMVAI